MGVLNGHAILGTQGGQRAAASAILIDVTVEHHRVEHRAGPAPCHQAGFRQEARLPVQHSQVVVELHPDNRYAPLAGHDHHVGDHVDRSLQRQAFGSGPLAGDPVHRRGPGRDLPTGVDQTRGGGHYVPGHDGDQGVGDGNVSEAVDPGRLEIEPQHLAGQPIRHTASMPRRCDTAHRDLGGGRSARPNRPDLASARPSGHDMGQQNQQDRRPTDAGRQVEGQPERVLIPNAGERTLVVRSRVGLYCPVSGAPKGEIAGGSGASQPRAVLSASSDWC